ncbi:MULTISPECIES: response regulator [Tenacibaculum]|uniref:Response regulator n=1 Tax=Tenacibaculum discolor TaxID=361581 RepID=A0A2G1BXZ2_9FLAO|nr:MULTISPECIES: response regulator transcription factor [Tenacibaculum]PHO01525.1 response regulator [Rhodobacteraceae bacterium 4F10]MDP2541190.1 response regulator transcription factor [Tenacibaculum discolor]NVK09505.1 response regulator transcription factor [Tenacibaculum sp.]PHN98900.1 response regulator [Tenacibaculum discolor]RLJ97776.1 response regulator receiver domain-containing protein [Tenacibaculum discolor]
MGKEKKIVIAEDNSVFLLLIKLKLEKEGYELFVAEDGKKAIELIEAHQPDLILTDIMMDYLSGLEVISHVRNVLKMDVPILVFSASGQEEMVTQAFNLGANDFMVKPLMPNELVIRVKRMLM